MHLEAQLNHGDSVTARLPTLKTVQKSLYRVRTGDRHSYQSLSDIPFPLPDNMAKINNERFLLHQSQDSSIMIFATAENLKLLSRNRQWYMDGTFNSAPTMFQQIFTIHCQIQNKVLPCVYVLATNKLKSTYKRIFRILKDNAVPGHELQPESVLTDFESGLLPAIQEEFPMAQRHGCYFHFNQCLFRKIQNLGLQPIYTSDTSSRATLRLLMALPFAPLNFVQQVRFDLIKAH